MDEEQNDGLKKLREMVKEMDIGMLTTVDEDGTLRSRPMSTNGEIEANGQSLDVYLRQYAQGLRDRTGTAGKCQLFFGQISLRLHVGHGPVGCATSRRSSSFGNRNSKRGSRKGPTNHISRSSK